MVAFAIAGAGILTYLSLSRDCKMVSMSDDEDCGAWSFIVGGLICILIGLLVLMSGYGAHIKYLAVTNCARSTVGILTIAYVPIGIIMMHSAGLVRDLRYGIDEDWVSVGLYTKLNAEAFCNPPATPDANDPCKDAVSPLAGDGPIFSRIRSMFHRSVRGPPSNAPPSSLTYTPRAGGPGGT